MWADRYGYYRALDLWRRPGGATGWLEWYSQRLAAAARVADDVADRAAVFTDRLSAQVSAAGLRPGPADTANRLVAQLPEQPVFTVAAAADATGKGTRSIRDTVTRLAGTVVESLPPSGRRPAAWWNRDMWYLTAPDVLRSLFPYLPLDEAAP